MPDPVVSMESISSVTSRLNQAAVSDPHSFSNPDQIRIKHVELELNVSFDNRTLHGTVVLILERIDSQCPELVLDSLDLNIVRVESSRDGADYQVADVSFGAGHPIFGVPVKIKLPPDARRVRIEYLTAPKARGLQ